MMMFNPEHALGIYRADRNSLTLGSGTSHEEGALIGMAFVWSSAMQPNTLECLADRAYRMERTVMATVSVAGAQQEQTRRWITAIHEAGHVLGERLMGSKIKEATILPTRRFDGQVTPEIDLQNYRYDHEGTIICLLLGHLAELEFGYRREYGHGSDYAKVEKMLKERIKGEKSKAWSKKTGVRDTMLNHVTKKNAPCDIWFVHQVVGGYYDAEGNYVSYRKE
jgi:hypothetical protein